ncbi:addiction module component [Vibrio sp. SS-MA-C1-2]|uniref:addiction module component n=1 Tax=Vibrio sp. SS-MA-C1-2 TaxID=2908646 RepID=UPI001F253085|nr:addiction module component [Vibrio sp. SS-MA-C1-2]UJF16859.1 addiction module component [Vibrio sp. SS-MA-C1-2]
MKNFTITYVVHPYYDVPCKYSINADNELASLTVAERALAIRHPEGVSIIQSNEKR